MSAKNDLQEYFQKRSLSCPKYETEKIGGSDHQPLFQSTVSFSIFNKNYIVKGEVSSNKKTAEMSAAEKALINVQEKQKIINKKQLNTKICLVVDLENKPVFGDVHCNYENLTTIGVCSRNCTVKNVPFQKIVVESLSKDSADTAIILLIAKMILKNDFQTIIILTKDHFGKNVEDCIKSKSLSDFNHATVHHAISSEEVEQFLDQYVNC